MTIFCKFMFNIWSNKFFFQISYLIATGLYLGKIPYMSGTLGSILAIFLWIFFPSTIWKEIAFSFFILIGIFLCQKIIKGLNDHDPKEIVLDEIFGMWIVLSTISKNDWTLILLGFFYFRLLDILKPWPICWIDQNLSGGIGIMVDDIISGLISSMLINFK